MMKNFDIPAEILSDSLLGIYKTDAGACREESVDLTFSDRTASHNDTKAVAQIQ